MAKLQRACKHTTDYFTILRLTWLQERLGRGVSDTKKDLNDCSLLLSQRSDDSPAPLQQLSSILVLCDQYSYQLPSFSLDLELSTFS